jgi:hypothetical protein
VSRSAQEAADLIERFLDGNIGDHEWDDFTSVKLRAPFLDGIRLVCVGVHDAFPAPVGSGRYCSDDGLALLRSLAEHLKSAP